MEHGVPVGAVLLECRHSLQLFLQAWGISCFFLAWSSTVCQCLSETPLLTFPVPRCELSRSREVWEALPCWEAPALTFSSLGAAGFQFWGDQSAVPGPPSQVAGSQEQPGFHHRFPGKEVAILCCLTFPEKTCAVLQSWEQVLLGHTWVALVYQVCSLDIMMAIKADAAFEQFTRRLCAWHCCRAGAKAALEIPLQHFDIYFWAKQVLPPPFPFSLSAGWDLSLSLFPTSVSGERS